MQTGSEVKALVRLSHTKACCLVLSALRNADWQIAVILAALANGHWSTQPVQRSKPQCEKAFLLCRWTQTLTLPISFGKISCSLIYVLQGFILLDPETDLLFAKSRFGYPGRFCRLWRVHLAGNKRASITQLLSNQKTDQPKWPLNGVLAFPFSPGSRIWFPLSRSESLWREETNQFCFLFCCLSRFHANGNHRLN